jgi:hypothetical protein
MKKRFHPSGRVAPLPVQVPVAAAEQARATLPVPAPQFAEKTSEQQELKQRADLMERRLVAASRLIAGLGRWGGCKGCRRGGFPLNPYER